MQRPVTAVQDFEVPADTATVKRFVHLAGHYRKFVKNFGVLAAPLTRLFRKSAPWEWRDIQARAFQALKDALVNHPVLRYPISFKDFVLATDASLVGTRPCLCKTMEKANSPSPTRARCAARPKPTTEIERLAVVWSIKIFRPYVYGQHFRNFTDHNALQWLMESNDLNVRLYR